MSSTFTIAIICHGDLALLERTVPQNINALCENATESYDLILVVDGAERAQLEYFTDAAKRWGIDELRFRWRTRHCAKGDPSNNGHVHLFGQKTRYLVTLEGDVTLFRMDPQFDVLKGLRIFFEQHPSVGLATRVDDHECWVWKLETVGPAFSEGVSSVNRVSSHFLAYDTVRFNERLKEVGGLNPDAFYDSTDTWYNYEDFLSATFAWPAGPGIAFLSAFPIRVYHCDRKISPNSPFYSKDMRTKLSEFERRSRELEGGSRRRTL